MKISGIHGHFRLSNFNFCKLFLYHVLWAEFLMLKSKDTFYFSVEILYQNNTGHKPEFFTAITLRVNHVYHSYVR